MTDIIADAKEITPDPVVEHKSYDSLKAKFHKSSATRIKITFADGHIIHERFAVDTLLKFIQFIGIERVRNLNIIVSKILLVSNTLDAKYGPRQKPLVKGYYLMACTSKETKAEEINYISSKLGLKLTVEIL